MRTLTLVGAGGHGRVVAVTAEAAGYFDIVFLDDSFPKRTSNGDWAIVAALNSGHGQLFCAIGDNATRARLFDELAITDSPILTHPSAFVSSRATIGEGSVVMAMAVVQSGARLGKGVIVNTASSIDHDCKLGDFVHIAPGARLAGGVRVGTGTWIGIGAVVREDISIGSGAIIAAGSAVTTDVADGERVGGVPARRL